MHLASLFSLLAFILVCALVVIKLGKRRPLVPAIAGALLFVNSVLAYRSTTERFMPLPDEFGWTQADIARLHSLFAILWLGIGLWGILTYLKRGQPGDLAKQVADAPQSVVATADPEVLTNGTVLSMLGAGLGEELVLQKIMYSHCSFSLSSADLANLKTKGVGERVIAMMLETQAKRGTAPAPPQPAP
jgi:hypothetical protein